MKHRHGSRTGPPGSTRRRLPRATVRRRRVLLAALTLSTLLVLTSLPAALSSTPAAASAATAATGTGEVWVTRVSGIVDPALAGYLVDTMSKAADAQAAALVIELDTPGGLDTSMRDIIQAELDSAVPVIFYVYPQGARAASAGLYILMGSDVAAMAPQTNLGAATPVSLNGSMDETMKAKVTNDAAAYIRGLATTHGRNADWAEKAVREAVSLPADDALSQNVIEFIAADLPALLKAIDGYVTTPKQLTLHTAGAAINEVKMGWIRRFLHDIDNPDIAYLLMTLGMLGIIVEFTGHGLRVSGIAGAICLLLSFYSLAVLPVNVVGIVLIVLAMILYLAEIKIQSHGMLFAGGTASLVVGGLLLFNSSASFLRVSVPVLVVVAALVVAFFLLVVRKAAQAMLRPHATGAESLVGERGVVISPLSPQGRVRVRGENWKARTEGGDLLKDTPVEVLRTEGLTLVVQPLAEGETVPREKQA